MFSRSFMNFGDDPFFSEHQRHMQEMDRMMGGFGGFGHPFGNPFGMLEGPRDERNRERSLARRDDPFGFGSIFGNMNSMMSQMHRNFENISSNPNGYSYSSSQVMSYSNDGTGAPKYFEASSSTKRAPGGVKETQKTMKDSESGMHKMAVGHHIGDRAHIIEKSRNTRTEEEQQKQDYFNMDESDAGPFDREWKEKTRGFHGGHNGIGGLQDNYRRHGERQRATPALGNGEHREREGRDRRHRREKHREKNDDGEERRREKKEKKVRMAGTGSHL